VLHCACPVHAHAHACVTSACARPTPDRLAPLSCRSNAAGSHAREEAVRGGGMGEPSERLRCAAGEPSDGRRCAAAGEPTGDLTAGDPSRCDAGEPTGDRGEPTGDSTGGLALPGRPPRRPATAGGLRDLGDDPLRGAEAAAAGSTVLLPVVRRSAPLAAGAAAAAGAGAAAAAKSAGGGASAGVNEARASCSVALVRPMR
jgi:hypothetical protein